MPPDRHKKSKFRPSRLGYDYHAPPAARLGPTHEQQQDNPFRLTSQGSPFHTTQVSSPIVQKRATKVVDLPVNLTADSALVKPIPQLSLFQYLTSQGGSRLPAPATLAHRDSGPSNIGAASATGKTRFVCSHSGCEEIFARDRDRTRHVDAFHKGKRFLCPRCGKGFTRKTGVTIHLRDIKKPCRPRTRQSTQDVSPVQHTPSPPGTHNSGSTHSTPPGDVLPFNEGNGDAEDAPEQGDDDDDDDDIDGHSLQSSPVSTVATQYIQHSTDLEDHPREEIVFKDHGASPAVAKFSSNSFLGRVFAQRSAQAHSTPPIVDKHPREDPRSSVRRAHSPIDLCSSSPSPPTVVVPRRKDPRAPTSGRIHSPIHIRTSYPVLSSARTSPDVPLLREMEEKRLHEMQKKRVTDEVNLVQRQVWRSKGLSLGGGTNGANVAAGGGGSNKENQGRFNRLDDDDEEEEEEGRPGTPGAGLLQDQDHPMEGRDAVGFVHAESPSFSNLIVDQGRDAYGDYFLMDEYDVIHDAYDRHFANIAEEEEDALDVELLLGHYRGPCSSPPMKGNRAETFNPNHDNEESQLAASYLSSASTAEGLLMIAMQQRTAMDAAQYITQADSDSQAADLEALRDWCQAEQARKEGHGEAD